MCTHDDSVLLNTVISYSEDAGIRFYATAESAYVGGEGGSKCISKFALTRFRVRPVVRSSNTSERPRAPRGHRRQKRAPYMAREYGALTHARRAPRPVPRPNVLRPGIRHSNQSTAVITTDPRTVGRTTTWYARAFTTTTFRFHSAGPAVA